MKLRVFGIALLVFLVTGCAPLPPLSPQAAMQMPAMQLCRVALVNGGPGNTVGTAEQVLRARQIDCREYLPYIQRQVALEQEIAAQEDRDAMMYWYMNRPTTTKCKSYRDGSTVCKQR